jgi:hypothetical protein
VSATVRIVALAVLAAVPLAPTPAAAGPDDLGARLRASLAACWNPPATDTVATIRVSLRLRPDGTIEGTPAIGVEPPSAAISALTASALRAVRRCAPYRLPAGRYDEWRELTITFDTGDGRRPDGSPDRP